MPVYHRTQRLQIYGEKPEVTQLFNDRYRIVVRCKAARDTEAWYNDNKSQIFADFGTLYNAQMSIDGIDSRTGEAYDNMVLVSNAVGYTQTGDYVVTFVYETLTATWTKEKEDTVSSTDNGLRIVERSEVATITATAPYEEDDIGDSTITSGGKTLYLAGFKDETKAEADAQIGRVNTQWLEAGTLSETLDNVGSQKAKVIEAIGPDPDTPSGYSLASKQESSFNGFQTNRFTFLKNNVQLSQSEDKVGSQLAISQQWFNPDADKTLGSYSLASKNTSDFEGIETVEFRFLKDNVILFESEDKVGPQLAIVQEVFNGTPATPGGYSVANEQESDVNGIPTKRYTFLKDNVILSESEDKVGSQLAITKEVFNGIPSTPSGYSIANEQESNVDGIPTRRFTFLKDDVELSRSEDKVGSQLAIITEVFNPTSDPTLGGYSLARVEESDVDGIPTKRFTFLKDNVELSRTNDYVGSQLAITREFFNPTSDPTETVYSLASKQQSDFEGIKTVKYVFLRDNVLLSQSRDQVGSQNTLVEEWFNPSDRDEKTDYSVVRREESNIDGIPTERYTFMRDCILRVDTPKVGGSQRVSVQAFDMTEAEVTEDLAAVTENHELIDIQESDYEGIKTSTFVFEVNDFEVRSKTENGLQLLTRTELSITDFTDGDVGTDTYSDLYLAGEEIDDGNTIKKRVSRWAEAGILSIDKDYVSEGVCRVTTTFLVTEQPVDGPIIGRAIGDNDGLQTIAVTHMQKSDGTSLIDNSDAVVSHKILDNFTYPGTVRLNREGLSGNGTYSFAAVDYALESPVNAKIPAVMEIHFRTDDTITYPSGYPLWNPTEWAYGESKGIAWNYVPFSISRAFRGYRTTSTDAYAGNNITGSGASGSVGGASWDMISGKRIFAGTTFHIFVEGGPENPVGNNYTLDYKISEAFQDLDGTKYYKHVIIKTDGTVPAQ